jgi:hypothetical protein
VPLTCRVRRTRSTRPLIAGDGSEGGLAEVSTTACVSVSRRADGSACGTFSGNVCRCWLLIWAYLNVCCHFSASLPAWICTVSIDTHSPKGAAGVAGGVLEVFTRRIVAVPSIAYWSTSLIVAGSSTSSCVLRRPNRQTCRYCAGVPPIRWLDTLRSFRADGRGVGVVGGVTDVVTLAWTSESSRFCGSSSGLSLGNCARWTLVVFSNVNVCFHFPASVNCSDRVSVNWPTGAVGDAGARGAGVDDGDGRAVLKVTDVVLLHRTRERHVLGSAGPAELPDVQPFLRRPALSPGTGLAQHQARDARRRRRRRRRAAGDLILPVEVAQAGRVGL